MIVALFFAALAFPLCAISVDVARWYVEIQRVQNAADAAATAGVTYLPDDLDAARARAIDVAGDNGYAVSSKVTVTANLADKPSQLRVTISSTIPNTFAAGFGKGLSQITRSAVADFNAPVPLGSPCNTFGNEPSGTGGGTANDATIRGPSGSVVVAPTGGAVCTSNPQFWAAIAGPDTPKANGDAFMTRTCGSGNSGCVGGKNTDFDPLGYFYSVHIGAAAVNTDVTIQVFDPAWIEVGDTCASGPKASSGNPFRDNENPYVADGTTRYAGGNAGSFCNGDVLNGSDPVTTSFAMREPTDTYQPSQGKPMPACEKQYDGYKTATAVSNVLDSTKTATYNADVAKVFRQWVNLCTFRPTQVGDYYIQVRTNVARPSNATSDGEGGWTTNSANDKVFTQSGDDTAVKGNGNNRFALRAKGAQRGAVSITGTSEFSIYANYTGASSTFNLVRVTPAAATKTLVIGFYDVGDASQPGTIQVLPPTDSNLTSLSNCRGTGPTTGTLSNCTLTNVQASTYGGKWQYVSIALPSSYTCSSTQAGGCWFQVKASFPDGVPNDTTTWTAFVDGDPIRLIE